MILFKRNIDLIRHGTGGYYNDEGMYVQTDTTQRTIVANVQPANNKDMELLPDGARTIRVIKVFTDEVLYSSQQETEYTEERKGDVLIVDGVPFLVVRCDAWQSNVISHYESLATEIGEKSDGY